MYENRRHFRLRDYFDVNWKIIGKDLSGQGTVVNISTSGVLLQTDGSFKPFDQCIVEIDPPVGETLPFSPKKGKVVWFRRFGADGKRYQCGVEFLKDTSFDQTLTDWLQARVAIISEAANVNILNNYVV